jgi:hypothetical protein
VDGLEAQVSVYSSVHYFSAFKTLFRVIRFITTSVISFSSCLNWPSIRQLHQMKRLRSKIALPLRWENMPRIPAEFNTIPQLFFSISSKAFDVQNGVHCLTAPKKEIRQPYPFHVTVPAWKQLSN